MLNDCGVDSLILTSMLKNLLAPCTLVICALFISAQLYGQNDSIPKKRFREYHRTFQISLFPGISTNGVFSGAFYNKYSLNIFGGASAGNRVLEIGLMTNTNFRKTNGIQIAGLANVIGANTFLNLTQSEERTLIHDDFEVNFQGIQFGGFLNYIYNNFKGIQITGGMNVVGDNFEGFQLAGIGNSAGGYSQGVHIAGLYNVVHESMAGFQISTLFNFTDEELSGTQIGLINKARAMMGKHSTPPTERRGLQIGLINFSRAMHGTQIGLINFGGASRGKQFGLINFYNRSGTKVNARNGTPVGILNFGSKGSSVRMYYNELFPSTLEYTTGNCLNCTYTQSEMPYDDFNKIFNQNALFVGYDYWNQTWGFGYGFQKLLYNKFSMLPTSPHNEKRMMMYGVRFIHLNRSMSFDKTFNLVTRLNFDWGSCRWGNKRHWYYWFAGVSLNYFIEDTAGEEEVYSISSIQFSLPEVNGMKSSFWPGYTFGLQF
jgi:hypothetical protein